MRLPCSSASQELKSSHGWAVSIYAFSLFNGGLEQYVEAAALAGVLSCRGGAGGFAIEATPESPTSEKPAYCQVL